MDSKGAPLQFHLLIRIRLSSATRFLLQLVNAIPQTWKKIMEDSFQESSSPQYNDITKYSCKIGNTFKSINILASRNFYSEIVQKVKVKATSVKYFENILVPQKKLIGITYICYKENLLLSPRYEVFQFKIFHNVLSLNAKLFEMHIVDITGKNWFIPKFVKK